MKTLASIAADAPRTALEDAAALAALCLMAVAGFAATGLF